MKFITYTHLFGRKVAFPKINNLLLVFFSFLVLSISFLETYKYPGFLSKHFFIGSDIYYSIFTCMAILYTIQKINKNTIIKSPFLYRLTRIQIILIPFLLFSYVYLHFLEGAHYPNYVFSVYHINLNGLNYVLTLTLILFALHAIQFVKTHQSDTTRAIFKMDVTQIIFIAVLIPYFFSRLWEVGGMVVEDVALIARSLNTEFSERFEIVTGNGVIAWGHRYAIFVKSHTEKEAVIFIPPTVESWQLTGNLHYMQSELYPRKLVQDIENKVAPIPDEAQYVMIDYGEWMGKDKVWPKFQIPKEKIEKIFLIDRYTLNESELKNIDYIPDYNLETWGLIKLKK